jgi:DNA-binding MarR family transcriptional regulator
MEKFIDGFDPDQPEYRLMRLMGRMKPLRLGDFPHNRYDLSFSQMELIRYVGIFPGCHLQDLAERLDLTSPTVSVGIRRLVKDGWVDRVPDPKDGRATCHYLTEKSQEVLQGAAHAMLAGMRVFLEQLNDSEQEQLFGLLEKAIRGVETLQQDSKNKENYGE